MKKSVIFAVVFVILISCGGQKEITGELKRIDFICSTSKNLQIRSDLKEGEYLTFKFLNLYYTTNADSSNYSRGLFITMPATDTVFTFQKDSTHLFKHLVSDCRELCGGIVIEEIDTAEIRGKLIGKGKWQIEAKTKYFDFKRVIDSESALLEVETVKL